MADIGASNWNEADASNSTAAPDGWPEGMAPSGVNDSGRAVMGAVKRWYDWSAPLVTGGTSTAYTLAYSVAPTLVDGMSHLVQFNAVNGASPTLNVNALGAKPIHFYCGGSWAVLPANALTVDQIVRVVYNSAAGTYRAMYLPMTLTQSASASSTIDFTGIPSNVNDIEISFNVILGTGGAALDMRLFNGGGSPDTGARYSFMNKFVSNGNTESIVGASAQTAYSITGNSTAATSIAGKIVLTGLQVAGGSAVWQAVYADSGGSLNLSVSGGGQTSATGATTGIRFFPTAGTITSGRITIRAIA